MHKEGSRVEGGRGKACTKSARRIRQCSDKPGCGPLLSDADKRKSRMWRITPRSTVPGTWVAQPTGRQQRRREEEAPPRKRVVRPFAAGSLVARRTGGLPAP